MKNTYKCSKCGKLYKRSSSKNWIPSWCTKNGEKARLVLQKENKLYWQIESNIDLSVTVPSLMHVQQVIHIDFNELNEEEAHDVQYTVTPIWLTNEEYSKMPDAY